MAIFSHQAVNQQDKEGTGENTHSCRFLFPRHFSLCFIAPKAPPVLSQNKITIAHCIKQFKNWDLNFLSHCQAFFCLRQPLGQTFRWGELSLTTATQGGSCLQEEGCFSSRTIEEDASNWSVSFRYLKLDGMSLGTSPWEASIPQKQSTSFIQPVPPPGEEMRSSEGKQPPFCCVWQAVFALAGAPQCVYNNTKMQ